MIFRNSNHKFYVNSEIYSWQNTFYWTTFHSTALKIKLLSRDSFSKFEKKHKKNRQLQIYSQLLKNSQKLYSSLFGMLAVSKEIRIMKVESVIYNSTTFFIQQNILVFIVAYFSNPPKM